MRRTIAVIATAGAMLAATAAAAEMRRVDLRDLDGQRVARIHFEHLVHSPIPNPELRAALQTRRGQPFQRRFYRADLSRIENLYRSVGYMDADVVRRQFFLNDEGRLHIRLQIDSGELWHVSDVAIELEDSAVTAPALLEQLKVRAGDVFAYGEVVAGERQLLAHLNGQGFAHATVRNRLDLHAHRRQAAVTYRIRTGRRMYFGPIDIGNEDSLRTRTSVITRQLVFREGDLYSPDAVRATRNQLARTGLFRSVTVGTPSPASGDSVQPVILRLQERRYLTLSSRVFVNNTDPGVAANVQESNFLGRGNRIGADASLGQPLQGLTLFLTERNLLGSQLDLTLSAGVTDEWGRTRVFADPADPRQLDLVTANHSAINKLDAEAAAALMSNLIYNYPSIERLWLLESKLGKRWGVEGEEIYQANIAASWTRSRNRPIAERTIQIEGGGPVVEAPAGDADPGGDTALFAYDNPDDPGIPVDSTWLQLLTDRAQTANLEADLQRDTRDNQIAPARGNFLRAAVLFAWEFGGGATRVLDGDLEARNYLRLGDHLVWAQAARFVLTGSLRRGRGLPQTYWKEFGGEGSVRGVKFGSIQAVGGGRAGANVRNELRLRRGQVGFVLFWDRAGVWPRVGQTRWTDMTDGYGTGLRWDPGIPLRLDVGWSDGLQRRSLYLSVGQAF